MRNFTIKNNGNSGEILFEIDGKHAGEITYKIYESYLEIDHTGIEEEYRGEDLGELLVEKVIEIAQANQLKIKPVCPFAKKVMTENENWKKLIL